jgi:nucleoside 2-deoxyribosyltransferase
MTSCNGATYKVYLASPLGFTEEGRRYIKEVLIPEVLRLDGVEVIDPWNALLSMDAEMIIRFARGLDHERAMRYGMENFKNIDAADAVLACLNGTDVDSGTSVEIGYATKAGKLVIGYRTDYRLGGESIDSGINLQVEAAIEKSGGKVFDCLEDAVKFLASKRAEHEKIRL